MTITCATCGFSYAPSPAARCPSCGAPTPGGGFAPPPMGAVPGQGVYAPGPYGHGQAGAPNVARDLDVGWLLWGAIAMIFCCQPFGIAAFVFMDQAKTAYRAGDDARAEQKMGSMRTCVYIGIASAAAIVLLYVCLIAFGVAAAMLSKP
jgi:hypothetical protein